MTRINCIPPEELVDKHLLAEYRELPRIFKLARLSKDAPKEYCLGTGHMKFFFDKLEYLVCRQSAIIAEMVSRNMKPNFTAEGLYSYHTDNGGRCPDYLWNNWEPTEAAMAINRARLAERLSGVKYNK